MDTDVRMRALAAHDAHVALLELKKVVDDAAHAAHAAELEAVHLAVTAREDNNIRTALQVIVDRLRSPNFETTFSAACEKLERAAS